MNCWIIGVTLMCAQSPEITFIHNYNTPHYEQPQERRSLVTPAMRAEVLKSMGMQSDYDFFCKRGYIHPMDAKYCATGRFGY